MKLNSSDDESRKLSPLLRDALTVPFFPALLRLPSQWPQTLTFAPFSDEFTPLLLILN